MDVKSIPNRLQTVDKGPDLFRGYGLFLYHKTLKFQHLSMFCGIILIS